MNQTEPLVNLAITQKTTMPPKLFISYSHIDEHFKDCLITHLSTLQRSQKILEWNDRKIIAGTEWDSVISKHLSESEIILFLVSPDFIASQYCYDKEVATAMEMHENRKAVVIPIILRPCDWGETPFSKLQATPRDARPISLWENRDLAYLDFVKHLRNTLDNHPNLKEHALQQQELNSHLLTQEFTAFLENTDLVFSHRNASKVVLNDIFTPPILRIIEDKLDASEKTKGFSSVYDNYDHALIVGDEQSGKTSIAKQLFQQSISSGHFPIYISGEECRAKTDKAMHRAISKQYTALTDAEYLSHSNRVLIVDDFCKTSFSRTEISNFLNKATTDFVKIFIIANETFRYVAGELPCFDSFTRFQILQFSNQKREELVGRWLTLGIQEPEMDTAYYDALDHTKRHLDDFVRKASVPSKPIFLLAILQSLETIAPQKLELTTYGYCYQYLIQRALEHAHISSDQVDKYFNFLTEIAGEIRSKTSHSLTFEEFNVFRDKYKASFLGVDFSTILDIMARASILEINDEAIRFKYKYIYYYFAGKKIADSLAITESEKQVIPLLIADLHREENANILVFITHHTKSKWILDEIQYALLELFDNEAPADLSPSTLEYITEFTKELPAIILEQREIADERNAESESNDYREVAERKAAQDIEKLDSSDFLARMNRLFRAIELTGQIVRNKHGSLEINVIHSILQEAYDASLRFLGFFLRTSDSAKTEVVETLSWMIKHDRSFDDREAERRARRLFLAINYGMIYGMINKIAVSVGTKEAAPVHLMIEEENPTPAISLITLVIELHFTKKINVSKIKKLSLSFSQNPVLKRILQQIILNHIYMHPVDYKIQQQLSDSVDLSMKQLNMVRVQSRLMLA